MPCRVLWALLLGAICANATTDFKPRRILFAKCNDDSGMTDATVKPLAVFMTCANPRGDCEVRLGGNHTLQAVFRPELNSTDLSSFVGWNSFFDVPLPDQDRVGCNNVECPLVRHRVTRFTYTLYINPNFPTGLYPIIWTLTDEDTSEYAVCWRFKIRIV